MAVSKLNILQSQMLNHTSKSYNTYFNYKSLQRSHLEVQQHSKTVLHQKSQNIIMGNMIDWDT